MGGMSMLSKLLFVLVLVFGLHQTPFTEAHPVTFENGLVISTINRPNMTLWHTNYSLNSRLSLGADYIRWDRDNTTEVALFRSNLLIKRWLGKGWQGNLYFLGGVGAGQWGEAIHDPSLMNKWKLGWLGGVQLDYETQRFYTAFIGRVLGTDQIQEFNMPYHLIYRIGFAPYKGKYDQLQTWMVAQISYASLMRYQPSITMLLRFFYKTALWEIGADTLGRPWLHLMIHF